MGTATTKLQASSVFTSKLRPDNGSSLRRFSSPPHPPANGQNANAEQTENIRFGNRLDGEEGRLTHA